MRDSRTSTPIHVIALLGCTVGAACSGGGAGGMGQTGGTPTATTATGVNTVTGIATGLSGTVATPAAASFGTVSAQLATSTSPTFDGSNGSYPNNVTFPLLITSLQKSPAGLSPVSSNQGATATVVNTSNSGTTVQIAIPSLGLNQTLTSSISLVNPLFDGPINALAYTAMGSWTQYQNPGSQNQLNSSMFIFGYETPQIAMPASGTAVFSGQGSVTAFVYKPMGSEIRTAYIVGSPTISANFASGAISGTLTMSEVTAPLRPWNDVSIAANIATGTNRFGGNTAVASSPGTAMSLSGSATGRIDGIFYGPAAQNLGAVWSLSDGTGSAIGTVVAGH